VPPQLKITTLIPMRKIPWMIAKTRIKVQIDIIFDF
jgi:hypothetical protein